MHASTQPSAARGIEDNGALRIRNREIAVGWLLFEVFIALAIAVGIVWWTIPKGVAKEAPPDDGPGDEPR